MYSAKKLHEKTGKEANHVLGKMVGASEQDTRIEAARKTLEFMERNFGKDNRHCKEARRMYEQALKAK